MKKLKVWADAGGSNPRTDWDNLGTMVCFHNRYDLGDKNHGYSMVDYDSWYELEKAITKENNVAVILPIYMYDHSGITISTGQFNCSFDSGQIGFIYITKEKVLSEYGGKIVTKALKERIEKYLEGEVKTYDQYLTGDVYGFTVLEGREMVTLSREDFEKGNCDNVEEEIEWEEVDSCGGFYGSDFQTNGMKCYLDEELHEQLLTVEVEY